MLLGQALQKLFDSILQHCSSDVLLLASMEDLALVTEIFTIATHPGQDRGGVEEHTHVSATSAIERS